MTFHTPVQTDLSVTFVQLRVFILHLRFFIFQSWYYEQTSQHGTGSTTTTKCYPIIMAVAITNTIIIIIGHFQERSYRISVFYCLCFTATVFFLNFTYSYRTIVQCWPHLFKHYCTDWQTDWLTELNKVKNSIVWLIIRNRIRYIVHSLSILKLQSAACIQQATLPTSVVVGHKSAAHICALEQWRWKWQRSQNEYEEKARV